MSSSEDWTPEAMAQPPAEPMPERALGADPQPKAPRSAAWQVIDLGGLLRSPAMQLAALALTATFVVLEARYNLDLLDTLIDPKASRESVQALSDRGKLLASIGISWACGRFLLDRIRPGLLALAVFAGLVFGVHGGLDYVYAKVIHDLPADVKVKGFDLFSYRADLLKGTLSDPDIPLPKDDPVTSRIIMGAFPIVLIDERFMLPARDIVERKANDRVQFVVQKAEASWPDYQHRMMELIDGHRQFVAGSRKALAFKAFGGVDQFRKQSGGFEPDPSLSLPDFVDLVRNSKTARGQQMRDAEAREIARRPDGSVIRAGDIPKFLDHAGYVAYFRSQAEAARKEALPTIETVESMHGIQDINSAIFLPPMAMIASLSSALTNGLTFVLVAAALLMRRFGSPPVKRAGGVLARFGAPIMLALLVVLLLSVPRYVFPAGPLRELEQEMHQKVGLAGEVWSRMSNVQALLLRSARTN